jgi:hypothetical protein
LCARVCESSVCVLCFHCRSHFNSLSLSLSLSCDAKKKNYGELTLLTANPICKLQFLGLSRNASDVMVLHNESRVDQLVVSPKRGEIVHLLMQRYAELAAAAAVAATASGVTGVLGHGAVVAAKKDSTFAVVPKTKLPYKYGERLYVGQRNMMYREIVVTASQTVEVGNTSMFQPPMQVKNLLNRDADEVYGLV